MLGFQGLDVYRCSIRFVSMAVDASSGLPRGQASLADQLRKAAFSIPLNIAEGTGRSTHADAAHHFAIARGSAMECAAILDVAHLIGALEAARYEEASELLERIVSMLTRMCR